MPILLQIIGITALVQGGGSAIVTAIGGKWSFLMGWAEPFQPVAGALIGIVGAAIALYGWKAEQRAKAVAE